VKDFTTKYTSCDLKKQEFFYFSANPRVRTFQMARSVKKITSVSGLNLSRPLRAGGSPAKPDPAGMLGFLKKRF
jgi:hypothetical protein